MDWEQRKKMLAENNFVLSNGRYIHTPTGKVFWILELKELDDFNFEKLIKYKCIYLNEI